MADSLYKVHEMINKIGWDIEDIDSKTVVSLAEKAGGLLSKGLAKEAGVAFDELGKMFNQKLTEMGKNTIDFTDMIKMPDDSTLEKMTSGFATAIANNIQDGIASGLKNGQKAAKSLLKNLSELNVAYERNKNASGEKTGKKIRSGFKNRAIEAFNYKTSGSAVNIGNNLRAIKNEFDRAENWEDQYTALLKYVKAYKELEKVSTNPKSLEKYQTIGNYTIDELKNSQVEIEQTLQNIFNVAYKKAAVGLTEAGEIDVSVKLVPIKTLDTYDITGSKDSVEVIVTPKVNKKEVKKELTQVLKEYKKEADDIVSMIGGGNSNDGTAQTANARLKELKEKYIPLLKDTYKLQDEAFIDKQLEKIQRGDISSDNEIKTLAVELTKHKELSLRDILQKYYDVASKDEYSEDNDKKIQRLQSRLTSGLPKNLMGKVENVLETLIDDYQYDENALEEAAKWFEENNPSFKAAAEANKSKENAVQSNKDAANAAEKEKQAAEAATESANKKAEANQKAAEAAEKERKAKEDAAKAEREALNNSKLTTSLREHFVSATKQQAQYAQSGGKMDVKESMRLVGANGIISTVQGDEFSVDAKTMVNQLIENLKNNILMSLHDHPDAMDAFTPEDINSFAKLYMGQGAQINGIIANGFIKTIDFTGISRDMALQIGKLFSDNISKAAQASGLFSYQDGQIIPSSVVKNIEESDPVQYSTAMNAIVELIDASLNDAFKEVTGKESTLKAFSKNELPELTRYLLDTQNSAENAIKPVEKLKNLIAAMYPSKSFDWSQYTSILDQFKNDKISGFDAINQITDIYQKNNGAIKEETTRAAEQERLAREATARNDERRAKLASEIYEINTNDIYSTEELERILTDNKQILDQLEQENLLTEEMRTKYDAINKIIEDRLAYQKAYNDAERAAEKSFEELDSLYDKVSATNDPDEANVFLKERKKILSEISPLVADDYVAEIEKEQEINSMIEKRITLMAEAHTGVISFEDIDNIMDETGNLESKLNRLGEVAYTWGMKIKDEDALEDSDAQEYIEEFEKTYDRIVLKLANGKNINILPDAKGLRALYKYDAESIDSANYGESEIEDVIFERVKKEATARQENVDAMKEEITAQKESNNATDAVVADNQKKIESYEELKRVVAEYIELAKQLKPTSTEEYLRLNKDLDRAGCLDDKKEGIAYIKSWNANVTRIAKAQKEGSSYYRHINSDGTEYDEYVTPDSLDDARSKLRGYIYRMIQDFDYTIEEATNDFKGKNLQAFVKSNIESYNNIQAANEKYYTKAEEFNRPIKESMDIIGRTLLNQAEAISKDAWNKVFNILFDLEVRASEVNEHTQRVETDFIGRNIGLNTPYAEIEANAKKIESYEDLCNVIQRYKELSGPDKSLVYGGSETPGMTAQEYEEYRNLIGRLNKTGIDRAYDVTYGSTEEWAKKLGIEIPQAAKQAEESVSQITSSLKDGQIEANDLKQKVDAIADKSNDIVNDKTITEVSDAASADASTNVDLTTLQGILEKITYKVQVIADHDVPDTDKTTLFDESKLEDILKRVFANIINPTAQQNDGDMQKPWALESTLQIVKGVLDTIQTNTSKIGTIETQQPVVTDVGNVLATENTLAAIKAAVEAINGKVIKGTKASASSGGSGAKTTRPKKEDYRGSEYFPEKLKTQTLYLAKFRAQLMTTGKLTDEVDAQIYELLNSLNLVKNGPDLSRWSEQFKQLRTEVGIKDIFDNYNEDENVSAYNDLIDLLKLRYDLEIKYAKAKDGSKEKQFYQDQLNNLNSIISSQQIINKNDEYENKLIQMKAQHERELGAIKAKEVDKSEKKKQQQQIKVSRDNARLSRSGSVLNAARNTIESLVNIDDESINILEIKEIQDLSDATERLAKIRNKVNQSGYFIDDTEADILKDTTQETITYTNQVKELINNYQKFSGENTKVLGNFIDGADWKKQATSLIMSATNGRAQIKKFDEANKQVVYTLKTGKNEITEYTAGVRNLDNKFIAVTGTTKKLESVFDAIKRKTKEIFTYFSGSSIIFKIVNELKRGIQYVKEIDSALTELKKVTDETEETYRKFLKTASKTGAEIGSTISDFTRATATFAKLGYNIDIASEMAKAALVYQNVGDGIESADAAAESIISTMKGFGLQTSEAMKIVDRFNEVGNRFSITSKGIGDALQRSASALKEGGNSLDESIGLITAANSVVQDPETVGTALKTLTLRLRGAKTELEDAGLEAENMAETTSALQQKLLALTGGKVNIMSDANTFKNTTQILREMASAWSDMNDIQRASSLELMGGKRQANILSAIIQNFNIVEDAIQASSDSAGK